MNNIKLSIMHALLKEDTDSEMAKVQIQTMISACNQLLDIIQYEDELEPWVSAKITKASDYIDTVRDYMMNSTEDDEDDEDEDDENMNGNSDWY